MFNFYGGHGLHGPDIRGVRPYQVIGLVWFANVVGAAVLMVEYLVVFPFPPNESTPSIVRGNVVLGLICVGVSWIFVGAVAAPGRTGRWTGRCGGCRRTRRSASSP
ncbi:MAG: hypothetical protein JWR52_2321 [Marmoricola sp.]|nr:hypothetical protein [Marmoricola sp.]